MSAGFEQLDDLLTRIHLARQRPSWRRRVLDDAGPIANVSTLRVLRAVEQRTDGASVKDVAEYAGVEQSTASRMVTSVVAGGLLTKASSADDQRRCVLVLTDLGRQALATVTDRRQHAIADLVADWPDGDVEALIALLDRLAERLEASAVTA